MGEEAEENNQEDFAAYNRKVAANTEPFDCFLCYCPVEQGDGITLRECLHGYCK